MLVQLDEAQNPVPITAFGITAAEEVRFSGESIGNQTYRG